MALHPLSTQSFSTPHIKRARK